MARFLRDEAIARIGAYHDQLDAAAADPAAFRTVFQASPPGIGAHEIDSNGIVLRVNPQELQMLGYQEAQMLGRPVSEFVVMEEASQRAIGQRLGGSRDTKPFLRAFRKADGSAITMLLMVRILRGPGGEPAGIRTVMTEAQIGG